MTADPLDLTGTAALRQALADLTEAVTRGDGHGLPEAYRAARAVLRVEPRTPGPNPREPKPCPRCGAIYTYDGWDHVHPNGIGIGSCGAELDLNATEAATVARIENAEPAAESWAVQRAIAAELRTLADGSMMVRGLPTDLRMQLWARANELDPR